MEFLIFDQQSVSHLQMCNSEAECAIALPIQPSLSNDQYLMLSRELLLRTVKYQRPIQLPDLPLVMHSGATALLPAHLCGDVLRR